MDPRYAAGLENMPRMQDAVGLDHYVTNPASRAQRLPPPQGLLSGAPYVPDNFQPPSQDPIQYYRPLAYPASHGVHNISPPMVPPSHMSYHNPISHHQGYHMAEPIPPPQIGPPAPAGRPDAMVDPRLSQYPTNMDHMNNQTEPPPPPPRPFATGPMPTFIVKQLQDAPTTEPEPERPMGHSADSVMAQIPNLLGEDKAQFLSDMIFDLKMRQQPNAARACGFGDRDRRVIDPPPIVELVVRNPNFSAEDLRAYLRYESYVMSCAIYDETGERDSSYMPEEYQHQRRLMGSLVSTPFVGLDENSREGCFFCFSDLSCRTPGSFRLKFTLMMIDPARAGVVKHFPILTEIKSEPFKVYSAKEFPGMVASSPLAKRLKEQGCIISIKKGNDSRRFNRNNDDLSDNDDEEEGEPPQSQRRRRQFRN